MNWCEYPHTALLLGAAVLQLHPLQLKMGKGQHDTGPCSRWESKKTSRRFFLGRAGGSMWVGVGVVVGTREEVFHGNLGRREKKKTENSLKPAKGQSLSRHTTPAPLPLTKLQARVSHLQDANAKGKERRKRWHGTGTGLRAEVGGDGNGRRSHCLATVPGHVHW